MDGHTIARQRLNMTEEQMGELGDYVIEIHRLRAELEEKEKKLKQTIELWDAERAAYYTKITQLEKVVDLVKKMDGNKHIFEYIELQSELRAVIRNLEEETTNSPISKQPIFQTRIREEWEDEY